MCASVRARLSWCGVMLRSSRTASLVRLVFWQLRTGMSDSVPLITDPRNQLLAALPFVHARARDQCHNTIRRAFDDTTGQQESVQVMLHLNTRNGQTLMEMLANVVRNESESCVILTGRKVECSLAGLLHAADGPATESVLAVSEANYDASANSRAAGEEHIRSVSENGSAKFEDADDENGTAARDDTLASDDIMGDVVCQDVIRRVLRRARASASHSSADDATASIVSSLISDLSALSTHSNLYSGSSVSSVTLPVFDRPSSSVTERYVTGSVKAPSEGSAARAVGALLGPTFDRPSSSTPPEGSAAKAVGALQGLSGASAPPPTYPFPHSV